MCAQILGEGDVARLVEGAGEIARLEHGAHDGSRIARIGAQIAVAKIGRGKQRRATGEIKNEIAARHRAVSGRPERERAPRRRQRLRVTVHHDLEGTEMALCRFDDALHHRKIGDARRPRFLGRAISTVTSR